MPEPDEISPSGSPVYRYKPRTKPFQAAIGDGDKIKQISEHIEKHIGPVSGVFHEIVSDLVHVDVHMVPATATRNFQSLITSGMSDRPMKVPEGAEDYRYAELMICLPPTWPVDQASFKDEKNYWPVRWLKTIARFPHEYDTWIGPGHTIPTGDPATPYASNTKLCGMAVVPPMLSPKAFHQLELPDRIVNFYALWPLYRQEMDLKLKLGMDGLLAQLGKTPETNPENVEIVTPNRKNACRKKFLWW
jgi:hypothetical protein